MASDNATVALLTAAEAANPITITKSITIDGNNFTLTHTDSNRAIDIPNSAEADYDVTIKNLTVKTTVSYCERGINYNDGTLMLEKAVVWDTNNYCTYALNLPGSSDSVTVNITNCKLIGNIALNIWGENSVIMAKDTEFYSVDKTIAENDSAICLNNNGDTKSDGTVPRLR